MSLTPQLLASGFSDADGDSHASSTWEVHDSATISATTRVWSRAADTVNRTSIDVTAGNGTFGNALSGQARLAISTTYFARVLFVDNRGASSSFSATTRFTTRGNTVPVTPTVTAPADNATGVSVNPTLTSSFFIDFDGDAHGSSTWEVYDNAALASENLVWSKVGDAVNLTSIAVNAASGTFSNAQAGAAELAGGRTYFVRVSYRDALGGTSPFSPVIRLVTQPPALPKKWEFSTGPLPRSGHQVGPDGNLYAGGIQKVFSLSGADFTTRWEVAVGGTVSQRPAIATDGTIYVGSSDSTFQALRPADGSLRWRVTLSLPASAPAAVASDGTIYVGFSNVVTALRPADGSTKWTALLSGRVLHVPSVGLDGTVYVGTDDGKVDALRPADGTVRWEFSTGAVGIGIAPTAPTVCPDGVVYANCTVDLTGKVVALDPVNGAVRWQVDAGGQLSGSPAVSGTSVFATVSAIAKVVALSSLNGALRWQLDTGSSTFNAPVIGMDGTVHASAFGRLNALDPTNGTTRWAFGVTGNTDFQVSIASDGTVFTTGPGPAFVALDPANGSTLRQSSVLGADVLTCPAIAADGTIYVTCRNGQVYALAPATGAPRWQVTGSPDLNCSPAVGPDGTVYFCSEQSKVVALAPATGVKLWESTVGQMIVMTPAVAADGTIYVGAIDNKVHSLNPLDGSQRWEFLTGGFVQSPPAVAADGTVYAGSDDRKVYALNPDGTKKWEFLTGGQLFGSPALAADGTIYVTCGDNKLYALNPSDGTKKWEFLAGIFGSPAVAVDGTVYAGCSDGKLYALNPANGSKRWERALGSFVSTSPTIGADGLIYVGADAKLFVLDPVNGATVFENVTAERFVTPNIAPDGTVYTAAAGAVVAFTGPSLGLAPSSWPKFHKGARNAGQAGVALHAPDGPSVHSQRYSGRARWTAGPASLMALEDLIGASSPSLAQLLLPLSTELHPERSGDDQGPAP